MPEVLPDLSGVATKDLVEHIGAGSFKASYINWSRTMELFRKNTSGWMVESIYSAEGGLLHRSPVGGYLLLRFRHLDGTVTPEFPQAVMDHKNNAIAWDRITARDITDTHRRGTCAALAFTFGLAHELWAKMPLESGYSITEDSPEGAVQPAKSTSKTSTVKGGTTKKSSEEPTESDFLSACAKMGLLEEASKSLIPKLNGDYASGLRTLAEKDKSFVEAMNAKFCSPPGEDY